MAECLVPRLFSGTSAELSKFVISGQLRGGMQHPPAQPTHFEKLLSSCISCVPWSPARHIVTPISPAPQDFADLASDGIVRAVDFIRSDAKAILLTTS